MKGYFLYLLKKRIPVLITFTVICLIMFILITNTQSYKLVSRRYSSYGGYGGYVDYYYPNGLILIVYSVVIAALALIVPIVEFSFKMKKITSNQAYSFPIKRRRLYLTRYLMGLIEVVIPFLVSYMTSVIIIICSDHMYDVKWFFVYLPVALGFGILLYSYISFFYTQANTILDGIVTIFLVCIAPFFLTGMIYYFTYHRFDMEIVICGFPFSPLYLITEYFQHELCDKVFNLQTYLLTFTIIYIALFVIALVSFIFISQYFKGESAGQKTTSWACYKILLPITLISGVTMFGFNSSSYVFLGLLLVLTYLSYALSLRKFNLGIKYWIICSAVWACQIMVFMMGFSISMFVY